MTAINENIVIQIVPAILKSIALPKNRREKKKGKKSQC